LNAQSAILDICREFSESRPNRKVVPSTPRLSFWTVLFRHNRWNSRSNRSKAKKQHGGIPGGILDPYLGIGEPLRVWNPKIHTLFRTTTSILFRLLCLRFFNCRKHQSFRIFFYFKCFTDPGLLKIRQLSTPCRCPVYKLCMINFITLFSTCNTQFIIRTIGQFFVSYMFLLYVFRLLCLRFFNCRKDQSLRIFFYVKCFTDPGLLKIRQLSTPCRCGPSSL